MSDKDPNQAPEGYELLKNFSDMFGTMVPEKDLLAVKASKEKVEKQAIEAQTSHAAEIEASKVSKEEVRQQLLQTEASVSSLEEAAQKSAGSTEELAAVKQKLEAAEASSAELSGKVLEYRRSTIVAAYNVPADTIADKTIEQLDNYEEALKAVMTTKGLGNYAVGGGGGGAPTPERPIERAKKILQEAEEAGHVYGGGGSSFKKPKED